MCLILIHSIKDSVSVSVFQQRAPSILHVPFCSLQRLCCRLASKSQMVRSKLLGEVLIASKRLKAIQGWKGVAIERSDIDLLSKDQLNPRLFLFLKII